MTILLKAAGTAPDQAMGGRVDEVQDQGLGLETNEGRVAVDRRAIPFRGGGVDLETMDGGCVIVNQQVR